MADFYLQEDNDGHYTLEDDSGDLVLEDGNPAIDVPFIGADDHLYAPTIGDTTFARVSQEAVEAVVQPPSKLRVSQEAIEVVIFVTASPTFKAYVID